MKVLAAVGCLLLLVASLVAQESAGFTSLFNGKDFTGWAGDLANYEVKDGNIVCKRTACAGGSPAAAFVM